MTSILEMNLAAMPDALRERVPARQTPRVTVSRSESGLPTAELVSPNGGERVRLCSAVDPWTEAESWATTVQIGDARIGFLYGCGFGYAALAYARRMPAEHELFVFERDPDVFLAMLSAIDLRALLSDRRIHWLVGEPTEMKRQLAAFMSGDFLVRCAMMCTVFTPWAHRNDRATYLALHESLHQLLALMLRSGGNSVHDTLVGLYNTIANTAPIAAAASLTSLKDAYKGCPAFVIGNGPSLDANIEQLRAAQGKALLLTAESALQPCLRRGIVPDAVCVTERTPNVYHIHFREHELPPDLAMVGLTLVDPRVPPLFGDRWLPVFRSVETSTRWVRQALGEQSALNGGSSSAHLAFELALWTGADPIVFVGMDLAFGADRMTHSRMSDYAEGPLVEQVKQLQAEETITAAGIDGRPVETTRLWQEFRLWLEHQIGLYPGRQFIDATEGGARIEGTALATLAIVVERGCEAAPECPRLAALLAELAEAAPPALDAPRLSLLRELSAIRGQLQAWRRQAEQERRSCRVIQAACELHSRHEELLLPPFMGDLVRQMDRAYLPFTTDERLSVYLSPVIYAYQKQTMELGPIDSLARLDRLARTQEAMFDMLRRLCESLLEQFEALAEMLDQPPQHR
ncbi:hypothetical protein PA598K_03532 [Paenibacillus sp. 598K]|uniref:motility associated factor glycosyltransferase family protein n=1 Tax=Paenibacillus sp. 598K TaxID=1117987 RepID=UPI000FFA1BEB|nr:6-hydroxymethylpterin diphosphokinase MptE-like protein [Paenibacillus sp. 598K]GBF75147.1 hypothetical protein PA598K_03532 [Paenibacillus sp. 598K]